MSIRYKIALLFSVLVSIILVVIGILVYLFSAREREANFRSRLEKRALSFSKAVTSTQNGKYLILSKLDTASVASLYNKTILLLNERNEQLYSYSDEPGQVLSLTPEQIDAVREEGTIYFAYGDQDGVAVLHKQDGLDWIVVALASDKDGLQFLNGLKQLLILFFLISVVGSFFAGMLFSRTMIRPLRRIVSEVNLISSNNLSHRIQSGNARDELNQLSTTFNNLLDRLQESFIIQRRFISNASHELSTPLTSVSSQLEVTLQKERSVEEYKKVISSVYEDVVDLQLLTRSLLEIARTGSQASIDLSDVRVDELLLKVASDVQKLQKDYSVQLNFDQMTDDESLLTVYGNSNLLYIAIKNIVENGCKYSANHTASVQVLFEGSTLVLSVHSEGDIIAESDIQNIFQPFFRTETARQKQGFGLGLTLTKRILSLHKFSISVTSHPGEGTVFIIRMLTRGK